MTLEAEGINADRFYPAYPVLAVSIAVFRHGRVLLATRTKPPFQGAYSLPGGRVETGETLQEAVLRELWEEVQVEARILAFNQHVETIVHDHEGRVQSHFVIASFAGIWLAGEGSPGPEAGEIVWLEPLALAGLRTTPDIIPVIEGARRLVNEAI